MKWWIVCLLAGTAACGESESERCEGNVAHVLLQDDHHEYWQDMDCGAGYCVESDYFPGFTKALCSPEPEPIAACLEERGRNSDFIACVGAERVKCSYGYAFERRDCSAPELCEPSTQNCLVRPGVDATCAAQIAATGRSDGYCEASYAIGCDHEFVTRMIDCGQPDLCHFAAGAGTAPGHGQCVLSTTPDPRCPAPDGTPYTKQQCEGTSVLKCFDGYLTGVDDCTDPEFGSICSTCM